MRIIDTVNLTKDIHFPITQAVYSVPPKRKWYQKIIKFFTYRRWFEVMKDYVLWVPSLGCFIFIPITFLFDGASVPKFLGSLFSPTGMLLLGALPHDFGYRYKCLILVDEITCKLSVRLFNKKELDEVFKDLCAWESGLKRASGTAKTALTIAGFTGWNKNRKENRILKDDFPGLFTEL